MQEEESSADMILKEQVCSLDIGLDFAFFNVVTLIQKL
jgi:hypothetical protein